MSHYRGFSIRYEPEHRQHYVYSGSKFIGSTGNTLQSAYDLIDAQHADPLDVKFAAARAWLANWRASRANWRDAKIEARRNVEECDRIMRGGRYRRP